MAEDNLAMTHSNANPAPLPGVVVVNDDVTQLNVLCGLLRKADLLPIPFNSAEDALVGMGQGASPALIITDLYMPGIDGWRFCRLLRSPEYAQLNQIPVLVVSATFSGEEPARIAADLGASAFLAMPVDGQSFIAQVRTLLKGEKPQDTLKVLVVEDSKLVSLRILKAFRAYGYQADAAFTVQEALTLSGQTLYDIAILDYHLPDGLGDGLIKELLEKSPECVCIMMTSDTQADLPLAWMKLGAAAYLLKPFEPAYLISQCERARRERALLRTQDLLGVRTRQLRESEEKFSQVFRDAPVWIAITDLQNATYLEVNEQALRDTGFSRAEVIGHTAAEIGWITAAERARLLQEILDHGRISAREMMFHAKNGKILQGWVNGEQMILAGRPCLLTVTVDITERKQAEQALRSTTLQLMALLENMQIGILFEDSTRHVALANQAFCDLLSIPLPPSALTGVDCREAAQSSKSLMSDPQGFVDRISTIVTEMRPVFSEELSLADGRTYERDYIPIPMDQQQAGHLWQYRDITIQKLARQKIQEQTNRTQILGELSLRMAESAFDFKKIADLCVRRCAELIGDGASIFWYSPDRPDLELVAVYNPDPDLVAYFQDYMKKHPVRADEGAYGRVIQTNQAEIHPIVDMERVKAVASAERREYYEKLPLYSSIFAPLRSAGRCVGVIGLGRNDPRHPPYTGADLAFLQDLADRISFGLLNAQLYEKLQNELQERIHAESEVRRLNNELEQRVQQRTAELQAVNKELEAFSYSVSHDLRSPLRALSGFSNALLADHGDQLDEQAQHYLVRIQEASGRMSQLIEDLLNLSRINRSEITLDRVDLSSMARQIAERLQAEALERQVNFDIQPGLTVSADSGLMKIALENLLQNALKFTGRREVAIIQFGMQEQSGERIYFVRDNGVGFDMAYAAKLFTPFQRLHGASEYPGSGIGLTIVQRIMIRHGGRIWPEAALNRGATFFFTLAHS